MRAMKCMFVGIYLLVIAALFFAIMALNYAPMPQLK